MRGLAREMLRGGATIYAVRRVLAGKGGGASLWTTIYNAARDLADERPWIPMSLLVPRDVAEIYARDAQARGADPREIMAELLVILAGEPVLRANLLEGFTDA